MTKKFVVAMLICQLMTGFSGVARASELDDINAARQSAMQLRGRGCLDACFKKYDEAADRASRAFGDRSSFVADIYFEEGLTALKADYYKVASRSLSRAVDINPNSAEARLKLAELCLLSSQDGKSSERLTMAKDHVRRVLSHDSLNLEARALMARCHQKEGNEAKATKELFMMHSIADAIAHHKPMPKFSTVVAVAPPPFVPAPVPVPANAALQIAPPVSKFAVTAGAAKRAAEAAKKAADAANLARQVEAARLADLNKKLAAAKGEAKKVAKKAPPKNTAATRVAKKKPESTKKQSADVDNEIVTSSAIKSQTELKSKAVLLTPMKGKVAPIESADASDTADSGEEVEPKAKPKATPKPVVTAAAPKPEKIKRPKAGFVPPPPAVPLYPMMQIAPPPPINMPPPAARPKPKPVVQEKKVDTTPAAKPGEDESEFLLDWGDAKKKSK